MERGLVAEETLEERIMQGCKQQDKRDKQKETQGQAKLQRGASIVVAKGRRGMGRQRKQKEKEEYGCKAGCRER